MQELNRARHPVDKSSVRWWWDVEGGRGVRWAFASSWRHLRGLPSGWKRWEVWGLVLASLDSRLQSVVRGARLARVEGSLATVLVSPFSANCSLGTGSTCLSFRRVNQQKEKKKKRTVWNKTWEKCWRRWSEWRIVGRSNDTRDNRGERGGWVPAA